MLSMAPHITAGTTQLRQITFETTNLCTPRFLIIMSRYNGQAQYGQDGGFHGQDPAGNGWTHTGSNANSRVDFYEKGGTRMDYYL